MENKHGSLAHALREAREAKSLSVRQVAARVGIHHGYLARLENGEKDNPSAELLQALAEVLGLDAAELLKYIGVKPSSTLPPLRDYFPRKYGVSADEANILANLVEYQLRKQRGEDEATDEPRNKGPG